MLFYSVFTLDARSKGCSKLLQSVLKFWQWCSQADGLPQCIYTRICLKSSSKFSSQDLRGNGQHHNIVCAAMNVCVRVYSLIPLLVWVPTYDIINDSSLFAPSHSWGHPRAPTAKRCSHPCLFWFIDRLFLLLLFPRPAAEWWAAHPTPRPQRTDGRCPPTVLKTLTWCPHLRPMTWKSDSQKTKKMAKDAGKLGVYDLFFSIYYYH